MPSQPDDPDEPATTTTTAAFDDDRLRLIFTCCHPALPLEARVALTLRTLAGLTTAEIARAFLVPEPTMAKRLVRAKAQDPPRRHPVPRAAGAPAARAHRRGARRALPALQRGLRRHRRRRPGAPRACAPRPSAWPAPSPADARRARGARPARAHAAARRPARPPGRTARRPGHPRGPGPRPLGREPRSTRAWPSSTRRCGASAPGPYQLQAAIAACHATAADAADTDWDEIAALYERAGAVGALRRSSS